MELKPSQPTSEPQEGRPRSSSRRKLLGVGAVLAAGAAIKILDSGSILANDPPLDENAKPNLLKPEVNVLENANAAAFNSTSELLEGQERDRVIRSFKEFLLAGFTEGGIQVLKSRDWLREGDLMARRDITRDGESDSLFYEETPHFLIYVKQDESAPVSPKKTIEKAQFKTGFVGDDKMVRFRDEIRPLMKEARADFEEVPSMGTEETAQPALIANKNQVGLGVGNFDYVAELTPLQKVARDDKEGEFGAVNLELRLKNEGLMSLERTVTYIRNPQKETI